MRLRMRMHVNLQMQMRLGRTGMVREGFMYVGMAKLRGMRELMVPE